MKKILFLFAFVLCVFNIYAQQFAVSYTFDKSFAPKILSGDEAVLASEALQNGEKLVSVELNVDGRDTFAKVEIQKNIRNLFYDAGLRFDLEPKTRYRLTVESVKFILRGTNNSNDFVMLGTSLSGQIPDERNKHLTSQEIKLSTSFSEFEFCPFLPAAEGIDNISVWISGRGLRNELIFDIKEVIVSGSYEKSDYKAIIAVSDDVKQKVIFGIDAERLWHWRADMKEELAHVGVGEMKSDFVRVAVTSAYEREEGKIDEAVYEPILTLMQSLKDVNPAIKFFASPRPLFEAYSNPEKVKIWGHQENVPWAPYPTWILEWVQNGTKKMPDGTVVPKWIEGRFDMDALVRFYADYLNYMYQKGFEITYLDVTNEKQINSLEASKYLSDNLSKKLHKGVSMPLLIVPSSWNIAGATEWLKKVDTSKGEHNSFQIVSTHNTGFGGSCEDFMAEARRLGKEAWNTELHAWTGVDNKEEILNSDIFWEHIRAGFNGIDTWLFYGPAGGRGHTMIWVDGKKRTITKSTKYEIFKQVVNNSTGGNYLDVSMPFAATMTTAFIKDDILSVWVLNKSKRGIKDAKIDVSKWRTAGKTVEVVKWSDGLPRAGAKTRIKANRSKFLYDIDGESLYFFKIKLK